MTDTIHKKGNDQEKLSFFDYALEVVGWLQVVASPLLGGVIVGGIIYLLLGHIAGLVMGISVALIALIIGIVISNRIWKRKGTIYFMLRVNASPELDNIKSESCKDKQHAKNS